MICLSIKLSDKSGVLNVEQKNIFRSIIRINFVKLVIAEDSGLFCILNTVRSLVLDPLEAFKKLRSGVYEN